MIFGLTLLAIIYVIWHLLVRGLLWKIILFFAGWVGIYLILRTQPWAQTTVMTVLNYKFGWGIIIPSIICFLALLNTPVQE